MTLDPALSRPSTGAFDALDGLPIPLVVRGRNGRLRFANAAARDRLSLAPDGVPVAGLTRLGPAAADASSSFALTVGRSIRRRVDARCAAVRGDDGDPLEVLLLMPVDPDAVAEGLEALDRRGRALARTWDGEDPWAAAALIGRLVDVLAPSASRQERSATRGVAAQVIRRLRRRATGDVRVAVRTVLSRSARRNGPVDAIALTELVLSAWELLTADATGGTLLVTALDLGPRLRFELDAAAVEGVDLPDLRRRRTLLRSLRPALRRLGATFEVHSGRRSPRRIVVTVPLRRSPRPDSAGFPLSRSPGGV